MSLLLYLTVIAPRKVTVDAAKPHNDGVDQRGKDSQLAIPRACTWATRRFSKLKGRSACVMHGA